MYFIGNLMTKKNENRLRFDEFSDGTFLGHGVIEEETLQDVFKGSFALIDDCKAVQVSSHNV